MPLFAPIKRSALIAALRDAGFTGPYVSGKHEFIQKGSLSLTIPNPEGGDFGPHLIEQITPAGWYVTQRMGTTLISHPYAHTEGA